MGERFDVIVIGAGPGGYVAAIKCAKAGLRTAIVENRRVGGTCLNRGCIPAKAMIHASSLYREMQEAEKFGVSAERITFDYEKIVSYKEETTEKLCRGIEQLLKGNGVTILFGKGSLEQGRKVKVTGEESEEYYDAEHVILAAGSKPVILPIPGLELPGVLTSDELFKLTEMPESLVIIGGGVISVEFASVYANLGCKVTIVEAMPRLIPNMDKEISQNLKMILKKRGVNILLPPYREWNKKGNCTPVYLRRKRKKSKYLPGMCCVRSEDVRIQKACLAKAQNRRWSVDVL